MADARTTDDINPYAPPQVLDPLLEFEAAGLGVWRDGALLVMHKDAQLPPWCIKSGRPATRWRPITLPWTRQAFALRYEQLELRLPVSERWFFLSGLWSTALATGWMIAVLLVAPIAMFGDLDGWAQLAIAAAIFVTLIMLLYLYATVNLFFTVVQVKGNYLWISGPNRRFLQHLPPWTDTH
jgi:hypothetical protein